MNNEDKTGLVGIQGNKIVDIPKQPKEPKERLYQFTLIPTEPGKPYDQFTSFGVLVVTPGFVGTGNKEATEIRSVVPLDRLFYVTEVNNVGSAAQGSA